MPQDCSQVLSCCRKLGCQEGRSAERWVDFSLFGHQIVCHEVKGYNANSIHNAVDGDPVPVPHFGMALTTKQFHTLADKVRSEGVEFVLKPHLRFQGELVQYVALLTRVLVNDLQPLKLPTMSSCDLRTEGVHSYIKYKHVLITEHVVISTLWSREITLENHCHH